MSHVPLDQSTNHNVSWPIPSITVNTINLKHPYLGYTQYSILKLYLIAVGMFFFLTAGHWSDAMTPLH